MRIIKGLVAVGLVAGSAAACAPSPYDYRYGAYNSGYYRTASYYPSSYYYPTTYYAPRAYFVAYAP